MKIRNGFVSNSSSSSFVVDVKNLTPLEINYLLEYDNCNRHFYGDSWDIHLIEGGKQIRGVTFMDNGDLDEYLKEKGVDISKLNFEDYGW
jgi:hypothetical protein